jgi:4-hydroxy-3-methylbut-2-en-1-yl diphosphate reductase
MRTVLLAEPRSFCAGVVRAVDAVEQALVKFGPPVYVRRQIVHNRTVVERLEGLGAVFVEEVGQIPEGATVVFSAHGVSPEVRRTAAERELRSVDATCPLVGKVHREVKHFADLGYDVILIGSHGHDEVVGVQGEAPGRVQVVETPDEVDGVDVADPARVVWLSQTTLVVEAVATVVSRLRRRFPLLVDPPREDICYAAQNRQDAVKRISPQSQLVLVVGSKNSHNSRCLVDVAVAAGAPAAYLLEEESQLDEEWLRGVSTVGVTAGASAPESSVTGLLARLDSLGFTEVQTVTTVREARKFAAVRA